MPGPAKLLLRVSMHYEVIETGKRRRQRWRVTTRSYMFHVERESREEVLAYHWHPTTSAIDSPHLHLGRSQLAYGGVFTAKSHLPTDRISLEEVVRYCITELEVEPQRNDWKEVLDDAEVRFKLHRSWGSGPRGQQQTPRR